ncbi:MAG: hypothetical protein LBL87_07090 [Ruminococcus sp.]|jgi:hypothetical protein|nr:hypothetical protein [Ruminococcus sp.]
MIRKIDLTGVWRFCLDPDRTGIDEEFWQGILPKRINLPGTVSAEKLSPPSIPNNYGYADPFEYAGWAWYQREFELPKEFSKDDYTVFLSLERTRPSRVWVNSMPSGECGNIALPHVYNITAFVHAGKNSLSVLIDNSGISGKYGNMTAPDGQSNWNGICGEVKITIRNRVWLDNIKLDADKGDVKVTADLVGTAEEDFTAVVYSNENYTYPRINGRIKDGKLGFTYGMGKNYRCFDGFSKCSYTMRITLGGENADVYEITFGFTDFEERDGSFYSGNREVYIRAICDKLLIPDFGAAPCDTVYWVKRFMNAFENAGINTWIFIDAVPPEGAFNAADTLGYYICLELSPDSFSEKLTAQIMSYFGQHPSLRKLPKNVTRFSDYPFFPDFSELLREQVLVDYRLADEYDRVAAAGLLPLSPQFFTASALYAKESFKIDIDRTLMNMNICGFVLPPAKWTKYAKVEGKIGYGECFLIASPERYSFVSGQRFTLSLLCCNFTGKDVIFSDIGVRIFSGVELLFERTAKREHPVSNGRRKMGDFEVIIPQSAKPGIMRLEIFADDSTNYWDIFVMPQTDRAEAGDILVTEDIYEVIAACEAGRKILFMPESISPDYLIPESSGKQLPVGTLGLLIDNHHPVFDLYPCRDYLTARWREIVGNAVSVILDETPITPIIRIIDNAIRNSKLGLLFETSCGGAKIMISTVNFFRNKNASVVSLYNSIINYMQTDSFNPESETAKNLLRIIFTK